MSSTPLVGEHMDDFAAYYVEDSLTDLVEKLVTAWADQGLDADAEVPKLMDELKAVLVASDERVRQAGLRRISQAKRGSRR